MVQVALWEAYVVGSDLKGVPQERWGWLGFEVRERMERRLTKGT